MKKLYLLIIITSGASFLLSSCSRLGNLSVTKRHYRSGFYVDLGSRKPNASLLQVSKAVTPIPAIPAKPCVENERTISPEKDIQPRTPVISSALAEERKRTHKHTPAIIYASTQEPSTTAKDLQAATFKTYIASLPDINTAGSGHSSESVPFWFVIVCCIFIPPLGVALVFGIDTHFWISLILTLLFFYTGYDLCVSCGASIIRY